MWRILVSRQGWRCRPDCVGREKRSASRRIHQAMPNYIRAFAPGGTFFFTVNLLERNRTLLTDNIADLRTAFSFVRKQKPFITRAYVFLPDHLHCIWTLPTGDADFSSRWQAIKAHFARRI